MKGRFSMNFTTPTSNNRDNTHYPTHENQSVYRKGSAQYSTQQDVKRSFKTEPNYSQPSQNILVNDGLSTYPRHTNQSTHRNISNTSAQYRNQHANKIVVGPRSMSQFLKTSSSGQGCSSCGGAK